MPVFDEEVYEGLTDFIAGEFLGHRKALRKHLGVELYQVMDMGF